MPVLNEDVDYDGWQQKLTNAFFSPGDTETPVIIFLDEDELARICPEASDATESLRAAVASELRQTTGPGVLDHVHRRMAKWRRGSQELPPPCLPLLALTVIAGSLMQNDGNFSSSAYYPRLVGLLAGRNNHLAARGLKSHFDEVAELWTSLDSWIISHRDIVGPSTIDTHKTFNRIGYPLSQTIIRSSDRERLFEFFDRIKVRERPGATAADLLPLLRWWLDRPRGFSQRFVNLVQHGDGDSLLLSVISKLASQERERIAPALSGRLRLELNLQLDLERWSATWVIPVHMGLDGDELKFTSGSTCSIQKPDYGANYQVSGAFPDVSQSIHHRLRATGRTCVLVKDVRPLWILRLEPLTNKWQSTNSVLPMEDHTLLVRDTDTAALKVFLDQNALPGFRRLRRQLIPGWDIFTEVRLTGQLDFSLGMTFPGLTVVPAKEVRESPKLVAGLPLQSMVGGRHYLAGGEPDLLLPVRDTTEPVSLVLDGRTTGHVIKPNGSAFPLRLFGPYTDGKHVVEVDGITFEFFTHLDGESITLHRPSEGVPQAPSDANQSLSRPLFAMCRRGKNAVLWFVMPSGRVQMMAEPPVPSDLEELGFPKSYRWKALIPDDAAWAVAEGSGKFAKPLLANDYPPNFGYLDPVSRSFWRRIAQGTIGSSNANWRAYLAQSMEDSIHGR